MTSQNLVGTSHINYGHFKQGVADSTIPLDLLSLILRSIINRKMWGLIIVICIATHEIPPASPRCNAWNSPAYHSQNKQGSKLAIWRNRIQTGPTCSESLEIMKHIMLEENWELNGYNTFNFRLLNVRVNRKQTGEAETESVSESLESIKHIML